MLDRIWLFSQFNSFVIIKTLGLDDIFFGSNN